MTTKRRYTFWINEAEADGLKQVKEAEGIAESEQIRQAIRDWLRKHDVKRAAHRAGSAKRSRLAKDR